MTVLGSINSGKNQFVEAELGFVSFAVGVFSLWYLGKMIGVKVFKFRGYQTSNAFRFILKNIVAPVVVSLIIYTLIGETTLTFISIPIVGMISASIGI